MLSQEKESNNIYNTAGNKHMAVHKQAQQVAVISLLMVYQYKNIMQNPVYKYINTNQQYKNREVIQSHNFSLVVNLFILLYICNKLSNLTVYLSAFFMIIDGKEYIVQMEGQIFHCAMDITMNFIGGKWKTVVLWYLTEG